MAKQFSNLAYRPDDQRTSKQPPFAVLVLIGVLLGGVISAGMLFVAFKMMFPETSSGGSAAASSGSSSGSSWGGMFGSSGPARNYSTHNDEKTLTPDLASTTTPLRAHRDHPWIKLTKAEIEKVDGTREPLMFWRKGERIVLNYESSADFRTHPAMGHAKPMVILKNERGEATEWHYRGLDQFTAKGHWYMMDGSNRIISYGNDKVFTPNMEVYVVLEDIYEHKKMKRFKISNSLAIGDKAGITLARDWKDDEVKSIEDGVKTKTPLTTAEAEYQAAVAKMGMNPEMRKAVEAFGSTAPANAKKLEPVGEVGGRYYENAKDGEPLIGLSYTFGAWGRAKSIGQIRPLFKSGAAAPFPQKVVAKEGYAVGGINLEASPYFSGFQIIFMKIDGKKLNPADSYTSDWVRAGTDKPTASASQNGNGQLVIGIHGNVGAITNTMGLIVQ